MVKQLISIQDRSKSNYRDIEIHYKNMKVVSLRSVRLSEGDWCATQYHLNDDVYSDLFDIKQIILCLQIAAAIMEDMEEDNFVFDKEKYLK